VKAAKWGKELLQRPGVYVVAGTADVMGIVEEELVSERRLSRDRLALLTTSLRRSDLA